MLSRNNAKWHVFQAIKKKADKDAVFTSAALREELGFETDSGDARTLHSTIQKLKQDGVLTTVDERGRHQHMRVLQETVPTLDRMTLKAGRKVSSHTSNGQAIQRTPRRVLNLEQRVESIEERSKKQEIQLEQLVQEVRQLKGEVHELVQLWS